MQTTTSTNGSANGSANGHSVSPKQAAKFVAPAKTLGYKPIDDRWFRQPRDLPCFDFSVIHAMLWENTIKLGLAMREAPLLQAEFAYKEGEEWKPGIQCEDEVVGAFILRQYKTIWQQLDLLTSDQVWGWVAGEMTLRLSEQGVVEIDRFFPRHARDTRLLETAAGVPWGVRVSRVENATGGCVDLPFPWNRVNAGEGYAFFQGHRPQPGCHYGDSILRGAYSPWADKWLEGGALSVRRKFMFKDAYGGTDMTYPEGSTMVGTESVPNEKIASEIVEQLEAGGVTVRPSDVDPATTKEKWTITRATVPSNPQHILQFPKDLDTEELRGMEIPDDVLTAEATGSWAGKTVPMQAFYNGLETWLRCKLRALKPTIDYLVILNYGRKYWYEVATKPLALQAMEQQGEKKAPGPGLPGQPDEQGQQQGQQGQGGPQGGIPGHFVPHQQGQQQGQRMGLDPVLAVGEGVLNAAELVKAARAVMRTKLARQLEKKISES